MQVNTYQLWRNRTILEATTSLRMKRHDTNPEPAIEVLVNGDPFSLIGAGVVGRLRFSLKLNQDLVENSTRLTASRDLRVQVDDILIIDSERLRVTKVDSASDRLTLRLTVERGVNGTEKAAHSSGAVISVLIAERQAVVLGTLSGSGHRCYLPLQSGDTSRSGTYEVEFEVTESTGGKFTIPQTPVKLIVSDDFEGA